MEHVLAVVFEKESHTVIGGGPEGIQSWDADIGEQLDIFRKVGGNYVRCLALNPDGRLLASGREDGLIHLWDLESGKIHKTLNWHPSRLHSLAFSSDGKILASAANEFIMYVWDIKPLGDVTSYSVTPKNKATVLWGDLKQR